MAKGSNNNQAIETAILRQLAEDRLGRQTAHEQVPRTDEELQRLVHELEVHKIELEMQNAELRQSREEVEAGLEKYTDLYDFAPVGYFTLDRNGTITAANLTAARLLGSERSRLADRRFVLFLMEKDRSAFTAFLDRVFTNDARETCIVELLKENAPASFVQISATAGAEHQDCKLVLSDISEYKQAQKAMLESEELLRFFIEYAPAALAMLDRNMCYLYASSRWRSDYRLGDRILQGVSHYEIFPEIPARWKDAHRRALGGETLREEADLFLRADGSEQWLRWEIRPWLDVSGTIAGIVIYTEDITDEKRVEEALRNTQQVYRAIGETIDYGVWVCDPDGRNIYCSESFLRLVGMTQEQCADFGWGEVLHPDDVARTLAAWRECVRTECHWDVEHRFLGVDGCYHPVLARGVPVRNTHGEIIYWAGINLDISQQKRVEVELKLAEQELQQSHDMLEARVMMRTEELLRTNEQLTHEIEERKRAEESLSQAYAEIKQLKIRLEAENIYLQSAVAEEHNFGEFIGQSAILEQLFIRIKQVAPMNATVLLMGETGTGKGVVARAIHSSSIRKDRPMITVNCSSLPANLIESELFGRERGAFTGANSRQIGRFELADGGTIFLDEISELPLELQSKLLRVIQDGEFERLGNPRTIKVDVRIIAASNRNLPEEIRIGRFREDLFYRLNVFPITIPPLRQRPEDIPLLVYHFIDKFNKKNAKKIASVSREVLKTLQQYQWPGNVRELENVIERAVIVCQGTVLQVLDPLQSSHAMAGVAGQDIKALAELEYSHITEVLRQTGWRIEGEKGAAAILDLNPSTLRARMRKYGIKRQ